MPKEFTQADAEKWAKVDGTTTQMRAAAVKMGYDPEQVTTAVLRARAAQMGGPSTAPTSKAPDTVSAPSKSVNSAPSLSDPTTPWWISAMRAGGPESLYNPGPKSPEVDHFQAEMGTGIFEGAGDTVGGLYQAFRHPLDTTSNLWSAVRHPQATLGGIATGVKKLGKKISDFPQEMKDNPDEAARDIGRPIGSAATFELGGGLLKGAEELGEAGKIASKIVKPVTVGSASPAVIAAGDRSLQGKTSEEKAKAVGENIGPQVVLKAADSFLFKGLGFADKQLTGGKVSQMLPEDTAMLNSSAGRAAENIRKAGIRTVGKLSPVDFASYMVGKGVKFAIEPNGFKKNANTGRADLVKWYAEQLEISQGDLTKMGYTDADLKAIETKSGVPVKDALGHLANDEITPEVIKASRAMITDRYDKFWDGKNVTIDGNSLSSMSKQITQKLGNSLDSAKEFIDRIQQAAPNLVTKNGKLVSQKMSGPEFQKMRSAVSSLAHELSAKISGPGGGAADLKLRPVADALHAVKNALDDMADKSLQPGERLELKGLRKTYQAVSDFDGAMRNNKLQGGVYMSPTDLLDYIRQSNPDRFARASADPMVQMGRDFDTLGIESKPRGLVTKYGARRYAAGRNAVVNAIATQKQPDQQSAP